MIRGFLKRKIFTTYLQFIKSIRIVVNPSLPTQSVNRIVREAMSAAASMDNPPSLVFLAGSQLGARHPAGLRPVDHGRN